MANATEKKFLGESGVKRLVDNTKAALNTRQPILYGDTPFRTIDLQQTETHLVYYSDGKTEELTECSPIIECPNYLGIRLDGNARMYLYIGDMVDGVFVLDEDYTVTVTSKKIINYLNSYHNRFIKIDNSNGTKYFYYKIQHIDADGDSAAIIGGDYFPAGETNNNSVVPNFVDVDGDPHIEGMYYSVVLPSGCYYAVFNSGSCDSSDLNVSYDKGDGEIVICKGASFGEIPANAGVALLRIPSEYSLDDFTIYTSKFTKTNLSGGRGRIAKEIAEQVIRGFSFLSQHSIFWHRYDYPFTKGKRFYGIPYSSRWRNSHHVGFEISPETAINALNDPYSIAYDGGAIALDENGNITERYTVSGKTEVGSKGGTGYGLVCSSFASLIFGNSYPQTNRGYTFDKNFTITDATDINSGKALINNELTHVVVVDEIYDSGYSLYQATQPCVAKTVHTSSVDTAVHLAHKTTVSAIDDYIYSVTNRDTTGYEKNFLNFDVTPVNGKIRPWRGHKAVYGSWDKSSSGCGIGVTLHDNDTTNLTLRLFHIKDEAKPDDKELIVQKTIPAGTKYVRLDAYVEDNKKITDYIVEDGMYRVDSGEDTVAECFKYFNQPLVSLSFDMEGRAVFDNDAVEYVYANVKGYGGGYGEYLEQDDGPIVIARGVMYPDLAKNVGLINRLYAAIASDPSKDCWGRYSSVCNQEVLSSFSSYATIGYVHASFQAKGAYALKDDIPDVPVQSVNGQTGDVVIEQVRYDWNAAEGEAGHILNRPFYKTVKNGMILENYQLVYSEDAGMLFVVDQFALTAGNTYTVTWNGTDYACTAFELPVAEGVVATVVGNMAAAEGADTGEPFLLMSIPSEIAAEEGYWGMGMDLTGATEATVSIRGESVETVTIPFEYMPEGYPYIIPAGKVILPETEFVVQETSLPISSVVIGANYKVTVDGSEYISKASTFEYDDNVFTLIGNRRLITNGDNTGEPFVIMCADGMWVVYIHSSTSGTISIETAESYMPIDGRYLPEGFGSVGESDDESQKLTVLVDGSSKGSVMSIYADTTKPIGTYAIALGEDTSASGSYSYAEGKNSKASGDYSHAEGNSTMAKGSCSHAEGNCTRAKGSCSHAEGYTTVAKSDYQHVQGKLNIEDSSGKYAHIVGNGVLGPGNESNAHTLDWEGNAWYQGDVYVGSASGKNRDEGSKKLATEDWVQSGYQIKGEYLTNLKNGSNHASVRSADAIDDDEYPLGVNATSLGYMSKATGFAAHAEGDRTLASGNRSHAEGSDTTASAESSHAEGRSTTASGMYSHAEGMSTVASGDYSHAEGNETEASGVCSHVEGLYTIASGHRSHAEGNRTIASGEESHVQGRYNIEDTNGEYSHIVGNGDYNKRSNAHTLDWEGNAWYQGDVYVGSTSGTNRDEGSKRLATEEFVSQALQNLPSGGGATPDWNAAEGESGHILNRPFYKTLSEEEKMILDGYQPIVDEGSGEIFFTDEFSLVAGNEYTVTWNGTDYVCMAISAAMDGVETVLLGNGAMAGLEGLEDTGEPFFILMIPADFAAEAGFYAVAADATGATSVTVSIRGKVWEVATIPKEYLPNIRHRHIVNVSANNDFTIFYPDTSFDYVYDVLIKGEMPVVVHLEYNGAHTYFGVVGHTADWITFDMTDFSARASDGIRRWELSWRKDNDYISVTVYDAPGVDWVYDAINYKLANFEVSPPVKGVDYFTEEDKAELIQSVLDQLGTGVIGEVDADNNILITSTLPNGTYTMRYENADGSTTVIGTFTVSGGSDPDPEPDDAYTNLADPTSADWLINKRINSSKAEVEVTAAQRGDQTVVTTNKIAISGVTKLHVKGLDIMSNLTASSNNYGRYHVYNASGELVQWQLQPSSDGFAQYFTTADYDSSVTVIDVPGLVTKVGYANQTHIRLGGILTGTAEDVIITADQNIV